MGKGKISCLSHVVYDETLGILKDISLTVDDHKLVVFTGPNGGGKTTLAKIIMGLVTPTEGQILWNGQDVTHMTITERAKLGISYGFQQPPQRPTLVRYWQHLSLESFSSPEAMVSRSRTVMPLKRGGCWKP